MNTNQKKRVVVYGRVSLTHQSDELLDEQIDAILKRLSRENAEIVGICRDKVSGGHSEQRPGLESLLSDISDGRTQIDAVAVASRDRLSRNPTSPIFKRLAERDVELIDVSDIDTQVAA